MDRLTPMTLLVCPMSLLLWSKMKQPENSFTFNIFPAKFYQEMLLLLQSHQKTGTGNNLAMCAAFEKGGGGGTGGDVPEVLSSSSGWNVIHSKRAASLGTQTATARESLQCE